MKLYSRSTLRAVSAIVLFVLIVVSLWTPVQAQLGNTGVPVACAGAGGSPGSNLVCTAADGTPFGSGFQVPAGYYLHVTDIVVTPTSASTAEVYLWLNVGGTLVNYLTFRVPSSSSLGEHFTSPYLVVPAQGFLYISGSGGSYSIYVSGLLTRSVTFLPFVAR